MTNLVKYASPQILIGDYIQGIIGQSGYYTASVDSNFIPPGTYNQADYPELFAVMGFREGSAYTPRNLNNGTSTLIAGLTEGNGLYVCVGYGGSISSSTDGITWTTRTSGTASALYSVAYGNGLFLTGASGGGILTSTDAITWTSRTSGTTSAFFATEYGNGLYIAAGNAGVLVTSTDGITWTSRTAGTATFRALTYGNGLYVAGGDSGTIRSSTDGITWTSRTSGSTSQIWSLTYGNGLYLYTTLGGGLHTSTDGITWTQRTAPTITDYVTSTYGNGRFVAGGGGTTPALIQSNNGTSWSNVTVVISTATSIAALAYGNGLFLYGLSSSNALGTSTTSVQIEYSANYNTATQFVVPSLTTIGALTPETSTLSSSVQSTHYVRAK